MESVLYKSIFAQGEARGRSEGRSEGRAEAHAATLVRLLTHRLGTLEPDLRRRIRNCSDADTLEAWTEEIFLAADEDTVRRVVEKISKAIPV